MYRSFPLGFHTGSSTIAGGRVSGVGALLRLRERVAATARAMVAAAKATAIGAEPWRSNRRKTVPRIPLRERDSAQ
jgi:hypothetical protein